MCHYLQIQTTCFVCLQTMDYKVHQLSACLEWRSSLDIPEFTLERRFDKCADCLAQLPLERAMELKWIPNPGMVWVGEGWLIVRTERSEAVAEYKDQLDRVDCPVCFEEHEEAQWPHEWAAGDLIEW